MRIFSLTLLIQFLLLVVAQDEMPRGRTPQPERTVSPIELATAAPQETIYDVISRNPNLSQLVNLVDQTGFRNLLDSQFTQYTLFAPTNEAFQMFQDRGEQLDSSQLFQLMAYHLGIQSRSIESFADNELFYTAGALPVRINRYGDIMAVSVNGALVQGDLSAVNGHVIILDQVLIPPNATLYQILQEREDFSMFAALVEESDQEIINRLNERSASLTLFVPSNQAFENQQSIGDPSEFVRRFISDRVLYSISLFEGRSIQTESGESFPISIQGNSLLLGDAMINEVDINALNGVAHVLSQIPSMMATEIPQA